jgi:hypothetical protein
VNTTLTPQPFDCDGVRCLHQRLFLDWSICELCGDVFQYTRINDRDRVKVAVYSLQAFLAAEISGFGGVA